MNDFRPMIAFSDLIGVAVTEHSETELTLEFVPEAVKCRVKLHNGDNPVDAMVTNGLYFFGVYNNKTMLMQYLEDPKWINRDSYLFGEVIKKSFPGEDICFLPIFVVSKENNEALFQFTFGEPALQRMTCINKFIDYRPVSKE